ncbi:MAG: hypothetical protein A2798_01725 [Candidatus Levybacteria bacterium RIFCSPHIGHO2_01_FULL_37_17]|nr:MAG: hypothetical protein A2798_01725 [Candidatus Levybacteria bacterium RIFCSPHIGHO2_01_FULL_37_17]OGH37168.1 MAG: hypothetical protein A2959_02585 [Candidatus Levybacteria bacterium RIFCSPLOWO2_01_FULL_38_23]
MKFKFLAFGFILITLISLAGLSPKLSFAQECSATPPADAPNLYSVSMSSSSATLYFVQPTSAFDGYVISYGLTSSADAYSVKFSMGKIDGAVKYKVNDLFPKTNYFFKVLATNGCATGPWSSTVSTNLASAAGLPEAGPNATILGLGIGGIAIVLLGIAVLLFAL